MPLDKKSKKKKKGEESDMIVQTLDVQDLIYNIKVVLKINNKKSGHIQ